MNEAAVQQKYIDPFVIQQCLACAVAEGDIVNFRFMFMPASPLRPDSCEDIDEPKYAYLLPLDESCPRYQEALRLVQRSDISDYVSAQLSKKGPPQLPWELALALADNALLLGKYTAAAQAYELLRIRRRMQELIVEKADALLNEPGNIDAAAKAYLAASSLNYDYAAFPEPLPAVPNYQERALALHGVYPDAPEKSLAMQPAEILLKEAIKYLLLNADFSQRLDVLPVDVKARLVATFVRELDADWDAFVTAFREAQHIVQRHHQLLDRINTYSPEALGLLYEQLLDSAQMEELRQIPTILLHVSCEQITWWQCLKDLSYHHPGAALFMARQRLSEKEELLVPRCRTDSLLGRELGLCD